MFRRDRSRRLRPASPRVVAPLLGRPRRAVESVSLNRRGSPTATPPDEASPRVAAFAVRPHRSPSGISCNNIFVLGPRTSTDRRSTLSYVDWRSTEIGDDRSALNKAAKPRRRTARDFNPGKWEALPHHPKLRWSAGRADRSSAPTFACAPSELSCGESMRSISWD